MSRSHRFVVGSIAVLLASVVLAESPPASRPADGAKFIAGDGFVVAIPGAWAPSQIKTPTMLLHVGGDGKGVPAFDDNGSPLQVGTSVEHFVGFKYTLDQAVQVQIDSVKAARQLEQQGEPKRVALKLADGREAVLLTFEFIKQKRRLSTQIKMIVKGDGDDHWIVGAWAVAGLQSKIVQADDPLIQWLTSHLVTFSTDPTKKVNQDQLPGPFRPEMRE